VPGFPSKYNHKSEIITQIPGSHIDMVKFSERSDTGFVEIKNAIQNEGGSGKYIPWVLLPTTSLTIRQSF